MRLEFQVPIRPVPWSRAGRNAATGVTYTPRGMGAYQRAVAGYAAVAHRGRPRFNGPVAMIVFATFAIPKSWPKKKTEAALAGQEMMTARPDIDNIAKSIADALSGSIYLDDSQVVISFSAKKYGRAAGTYVGIADALGEFDMAWFYSKVAGLHNV